MPNCLNFVYVCVRLEGTFALFVLAALCVLVAFGYMIYKAVKLGKKERKKKIKQSKQKVNKFLDLLPPPGQTAPLDSEILQQMLDQSS
ncbi:hypothetical protein T12_12884 [Trichinella patagoniensis]|uniref:Uncharacterized protein n=1 Tax=Trichinella patagoniensis TaxID=990121 RepID=A0A0V0Z3K9_9BILA|nr:hypothetical protein T12_12884 [Trichinella patagoniensis]